MPRRLFWPVVLGSLVIGVWDVAHARWEGPGNGLFMGGMILAGLFAQIYRYVRVSRGVQRQQTK